MTEFAPNRLRSTTNVDKFEELSNRTVDDQCEFFLKSFIFALGDNWKDVPQLCSEFKKHAKSTGKTDDSMNHIQAADFLQKHGKTRTGTERKKELEDVDLNKDGQIKFIEYLMLHYKVLILTEYYKRHEKAPEEDLSQDGIGLVGVGTKLLDEVLTMPEGLSAQLELAIETFSQTKRAREVKVGDLTSRAAAGGVKGMAAKNELVILDQQDMTEMNRIELTLAAAKRKGQKTSGSEALAKQQAELASELKKEVDAKRAKMKARAAMFEKKP
ncbi:hypothetical protein M885DRAFT_537562 [Pelagophyceae sp. CCMP2097]|nr:hypothetical protein M885DRAFT_537562 [Pelagophyceae sp. CCMP2097]|mmetsp:Transcript_10917/g.36445  ORF Transcript_10917/g.36445 Transcript_10917/m.36445 type:complete len:271 (+) Transcript_10917:68-880(+)